MTLGKYSYALYVFHVPLIRVAGKLHLVPTSEMGDAKALLTLFAFPTAMILVSVAIAFASWHLYEKHFLNLKRFFEYSKPRSQRGYPRHFRQIELDNRAAQRRL